MADVVVPDLGDFADVPVAELLVAVGDVVAVGQALVALESDKASMEIPSDVAGVVESLAVAVGDTVSAGDVVAVVGAAAGDPVAVPGDTPPAAAPAAGAMPVVAAVPGRRLVVVGAGPGGYAAAFRAADLGMEVTLVERHQTLGGVCLNVGCIPSKALLHAAKVITDAGEVPGVAFSGPQIDLAELRGWKDGVVTRLTGGLAQMAKGRGVTVLTGEARFTGPRSLTVAGETIAFDQAVIAVGSSPVWLARLPDDERIMTSTGALALRDVPERLLVIGGGIIGLEMACVYDALGSAVTVVELLDRLVPEADDDLVKPLLRRIKKRYAAIHLGTRVSAVEARADGLHATFEGAHSGADTFDRVLVAVGRTPNGDQLGLDAAGVRIDERGFVPVDRRQRTNVPHIYAIGDVCGAPMLAHKATAEGHVAAEVAAGHESVVNDARAVPAVAYTDPEIAWVGLTERAATAAGRKVAVSRFPWTASGRAIALGQTGGLSKLLCDPRTGHVLGGGAVGAGAGELIAEIALAIEMGATAEDLALTIHPHPTLSETFGLAAELAEGTITDLPNPQARTRGEPE